MFGRIYSFETKVELLYHVNCWFLFTGGIHERVMPIIVPLVIHSISFVNDVNSFMLIEYKETYKISLRAVCSQFHSQKNVFNNCFGSDI